MCDRGNVWKYIHREPLRLLCHSEIMAMNAIPAHLPPPKPAHSFTRRPSSSNIVAQFFWRKRLWFESTFVLSMLEPWEKIILREFVPLNPLNRSLTYVVI